MIPRENLVKKMDDLPVKCSTCFFGRYRGSTNDHYCIKYNKIINPQNTEGIDKCWKPHKNW